jgi:signal transduction histidine kinase/ActR/RegA family two-component response regulator
MNEAHWKHELRSALIDYSIATSAIVIVTLIRLALGPVLLAQHPYAVLYLAVVFVAWFTGVGPSLFATFLGSIAACYFFIPPLYTLALRGAAGWLGMGFYWACSVFLIWVLEKQRQDQKRAELHATVAQQRLEELMVQTAERQRAELAESRANALLDNLFESAPVGLGFLSSDFRFVRVNRWLAALNRVPPEDHLSRSWREVWPYMPEEMAFAFQHVIETGKSRINVEINGFADAEHAMPRSWIVSYYPIWLGDEMAGVGAVCEEITERKAKESSLRRAQKLESLGVLAGGAAHVLNNVLTSILGHAGLLGSRFQTASPEAHSIRTIVEAGERATQLTRQMLAYSGHGRLAVAPVDLRKAVLSVRDALTSSIPRNLVLDLDLAPELPEVEADPAQIQQLVMNLVVNAMEAIGSRPGRISVTVRAESAAVPPETRIETGAPVAAGPYVVITVTDNGAGMDESTQVRMFDPFFSTKFTGRGLGLPAVLGIVRGHRGAIRVETALGSGSLFEVYLPSRGEAALIAEPAYDQPREAAVETRTILVVDAEEGVRKVTSLVLEQEGFEVLLAADAKQALHVFAERKEDLALVLLDIATATRNGEDMIRQLRGMRAGIRIVAASGSNPTEARERFGSGFAGFLQKPYTANTLIQVIHAALDAPAASEASV